MDDGVSSHTDSPIPVVGLGASAGGVEALSSFFDAMPPDSGCAFIVVLHLDPKRESEMTHILGTHTAMPVMQVETGMQIAPDHVYVIAPGTDLRLAADRLNVAPPAEPHGHRHPVDVLFSSIAQERHERCVAIVLSGTGSNGTEGLKAVRAEGGMSLVQSPETAKFNGMPRSAIAAGLADHVLAPEKMPEILLAFLHHDYVSASADTRPPSAKKDEPTIEQVLELLRARGGHDYSGYKRNTLRRRIQRRMGLKNIETVASYLDYLRDNEEEITALASDLLINVTEFFRDPEAWKELGSLVIQPLVAARTSGDDIRIWVPACATGEEAYSIAMLVTEFAESVGKRFDIKVFATDAQEDNLREGRDGIYPAAALANFPPERIRRFFEELGSSFRVSKELRDMVVFAAQNLLRDPSFSRLDMVSCRNCLIYLTPEAQARVIAQWHFSLRPGGHLFLGNAETIGRYDDIFETVSKKWRIYKRTGPTRHDLIDYRPVRGSNVSGTPEHPSPPDSETASAPVADIARRALLDRYAPASVLIAQNGRIVYFHGTTRDYLEQPPGDPTRDLLTMARDGLALALRGAIHEARKTGKNTTAHGRLYRNGAAQKVIMTVAPLDAEMGGKLTLVSFASVTQSDESSPPAVQKNITEPASNERTLQEELVSMRAELRNAVEHLETANEELKAANEEAASMNEELQSTNEELETSKEELQSFNEELNTVNSQLQHKITELERISDDLHNLLAGSDTATLFLDNKLAITWFAPATKEIFHLASSDIGRPIAHFARKFRDENLLPDAEAVLRKLITIEAEVPSDAGRWYLRRMLPYRTCDDHIAGVVITFSDITSRRAASRAFDEARIYAEAIVATIRQPLLVLDADLRVQSANSAYYEMFRTDAKRTEGTLLYDLGNGQWDILHLRTVLEQVLTESHPVTDYKINQNFSDIGTRSMILNARKLSREGPRHDLILLAIEDITKRKRDEKFAQRLSAIVTSSDDAISSRDMNSTILSWNPGAERLFGYSADEIVGKSILTLIPNDRQDQYANVVSRVRQGEHIQHYETCRKRKNGSPVWVSLTVSPIEDAAGHIIGASEIARDMTQQRRADDHRKILMKELNHRVKNTMAVIQSIASQTLGHASTLDDARETFGARLQNMAMAHDILTREHWQSANLCDIVTDTVRPHADREDRFSIEGPDIRLEPNSALALSMALHELCTNAAKYGALSYTKGHVAIEWHIEDGDNDQRRLALCWQESGGPPVTQPTRKGFGTRLIERALVAELGAAVRVSYEPSGLVCTILVPLRIGLPFLKGLGGRDPGDARSDSRG